MWWCSYTKLPTVSPVLINFMPSWWYREYGVTFGRRIFMNPDYRADTFRDMHRLAHERFGDIGFGEEDPRRTYLPDDLNNATLPAAMGCEVVFAEDGYPRALPLTEDALHALRAPEDIASAYPMCEIIRQAEYMTRQSGADVLPLWTCMGVPNIALLVRGNALFTDFHEDSDGARHLLHLSRNLMTASLEYFISVGWNLRYVWNQNCTVPLCGPGIYEEFFRPQDEALSRFARRVGWRYCIHHCGRFDDYAPLYRRLDDLAIVDVGAESDLRRALDAFPEARVQFFVSAALLRDADERQVTDLMASLVDQAGRDSSRVTYILSDLEYGTPDDNVRAVVEALAAPVKSTGGAATAETQGRVGAR